MDLSPQWGITGHGLRAGGVRKVYIDIQTNALLILMGFVTNDNHRKHCWPSGSQLFSHFSSKTKQLPLWPNHSCTPHSCISQTIFICSFHYFSGAAPTPALERLMVENTCCMVTCQKFFEADALSQGTHNSPILHLENVARCYLAH